MKNLIKIFSVLVATGFLLASCEGPMGPAGADGLPGIDANATCTLCHSNSAVIETKQAQWDNSLHATGENAAYANRSGCVRCHTSQGFLAYVGGATDANNPVLKDPMQINCYTCHKIHNTFTADDWALTKPGAETLILKYAGAAIIYNQGNSNQCVGCHQARDISPLPAAGGADFAITSNRIGVHHAPMANILLGKLPFDLPGTAYPTTNPHKADKGCIACHMATPYGYLAGGHNMGMVYSAHGGPETLNSPGCLVCHTTNNATTIATKFTALQTEITGKLTTLKAKLVAAGVYDTAQDLAKTGTFKANIVISYLTYDAVVQDKSLGLHNPGYIRTMLDNSITAMTALGY